MKKIRNFIPSKRRLMQLYFALLFNANLKGFVSGRIYQGQSKQFCVPGINCYSCPGATGACPLGSLQGAFSADRSTLFYVCGILMLQTVLLGRMICGWLCPFGLIQELLYRIPTPKLKKGPVTRILSWMKYVLLAVFVFVIPVTYAFRDIPLPAFCKFICPAGTLEGGLALLANQVNESYFAMLGPLFTWKFLLMVSILTGCIFAFRLFCRFLCPLGAIYGLGNKLSFFGIQLDEHKCIDCGKCLRTCEMDICHVGDRECISCGECIDVCPTQAIRFKGSRIFLKENEISESPSPALRKKRTALQSITAGIMAAVLAATVVSCWNTADAAPDVGNAIGDRCPGYALERIDENGILSETIDPAATGTITIVNFWGTWCTPCIQELPYFDRIASDYADTVTVIAVHTHSVVDTAPDFIADHYSGSSIVFAKDYPVDEVGLVGGYYSALGGRGTFPYTVILDENGVIQDIFVAALDYEDLRSAIEAIPAK